jgi:hypothetical protein
VTTDAVPLIAFCLLHGEIPLGVAATTSTAPDEMIDNSLLAIADTVAAMPESTRPVFIDLYRLSVLLGISQRYAEQLSLTSPSTN